MKKLLVFIEEKQKKNLSRPFWNLKWSTQKNLGFHMRYHFFLHYGRFLQNLGKEYVRTNMHRTVGGSKEPQNTHTEWLNVPLSYGAHCFREGYLKFLSCAQPPNSVIVVVFYSFFEFQMYNFRIWICSNYLKM